MALDIHQSAVETSLVVAGQNAMAVLADVDFEEHAGPGAAAFGIKELKQPYISVLQEKSKACSRKNPNAIPGALPGMFYNTVTQRIYPGDTGITGLVVAMKRKFVEWIPQEAGGGYVAEYEPTDPRVIHAKPYHDSTKRFLAGIVDPKNELHDTYYYYIVTDLPGEGMEWSILPCSGGKLSAARQLNSFLANAKLPSKKQPGKFFDAPWFAFNYVFTTGTSKKHDNATLEVKRASVCTHQELIRYAAALDAQIKAGQHAVKASDEVVDAEVVNNGDVPF